MQKDTTVEKVNILDKLKKITTTWTPGIVGQVNDMHVKLAKLEGEFVWHSHETEDELFYVIEGQLLMHFREGCQKLSAGEFIVIPKGVEHKPEAIGLTSVMLFEPISTVNTGDNTSEGHHHHPVWI